jgi:hypothetical protein
MAPTKTRTVGRPSLGKTPTERLEIRVDAARLKRWQKAADAAGVALSVWVRDVCDAEAR